MIKKSFYNYFKNNKEGLEKAKESLIKYNRSIDQISFICFRKRRIETVTDIYGSRTYEEKEGNYAILKEGSEIFLG